MTETHLVRACLAWLEVLGIPAWRNNSGATKVGDRFIRFGCKGSADILGVMPPTGRLLAVECKVGKNKPTPDQVAFGQMVNEAGGLWVVVRTLDDLSDAVRAAASPPDAAERRLLDSFPKLDRMGHDATDAA